MTRITKVHQQQHNIVLQQLKSIVDSQNWYCYAKTVAWEAARARGWTWRWSSRSVVVVGELLHPE